MSHPALRWFRHPVLAGIVGAFAGAMVILLIEWLGHQWFGPLGPAAPADIGTPMFATVLLAWVLGAYAAGQVATRWMGGRTPWPGVVGGLVLLAGAITTLWSFPHPAWMVLATLVLMPAAIFLGTRRKPAVA